MKTHTVSPSRAPRPPGPGSFDSYNEHLGSPLRQLPAPHCTLYVASGEPPPDLHPREATTAVGHGTDERGRPLSGWESAARRRVASTRRTPSSREAPSAAPRRERERERARRRLAAGRSGVARELCSGTRQGTVRAKRAACALVRVIASAALLANGSGEPDTGEYKGAATCAQILIELRVRAGGAAAQRTHSSLGAGEGKHKFGVFGLLSVAYFWCASSFYGTLAQKGGSSDEWAAQPFTHYIPQTNLVWCRFAAGNEPFMNATAPRYSFMVFLFVPLLFSLPVALMAAEMATALPLDGGQVAWIQKACGTAYDGD
eukprot:scaffold2452_cov303-Prasinococcus_capsulatus_cf.AAC.3